MNPLQTAAKELENILTSTTSQIQNAELTLHAVHEAFLAQRAKACQHRIQAPAASSLFGVHPFVEPYSTDNINVVVQNQFSASEATFQHHCLDTVVEASNLCGHFFPSCAQTGFGIEIRLTGSGIEVTAFKTSRLSYSSTLPTVISPGMVHATAKTELWMASSQRRVLQNSSFSTYFRTKLVQRPALTLLKCSLVVKVLNTGSRIEHGWIKKILGNIA